MKWTCKLYECALHSSCTFNHFMHSFRIKITTLASYLYHRNVTLHKRWENWHFMHKVLLIAELKNLEGRAHWCIITVLKIQCIQKHACKLKTSFISHTDILNHANQSQNLHAVQQHDDYKWMLWEIRPI